MNLICLKNVSMGVASFQKISIHEALNKTQVSDPGPLGPVV